MIRKHFVGRNGFLICAGMAIGMLSHICQPGQTVAQVLNQKVNELLANNCQGLGLGANGPNPVGLVTGNLLALCRTPGTGVATSAGGGAASVQGSAASILNRVLLQRLDETDEEEGQEHRRSASLMLNPMGLLGAGLGGNLSVSSPFYSASTPGGS